MTPSASPFVMSGMLDVMVPFDAPLTKYSTDVPAALTSISRKYQVDATTVTAVSSVCLATLFFFETPSHLPELSSWVYFKYTPSLSASAFESIIPARMVYLFVPSEREDGVFTHQPMRHFPSPKAMSPRSDWKLALPVVVVPVDIVATPKCPDSDTPGVLMAAFVPDRFECRYCHFSLPTARTSMNSS